MKHTKNMYYKDSTEAYELFLYATNTGSLYFSRVIPAINNLHNKYSKGIYNTDKAIDMYYYIATAANDLYKKEFGYSFTVTERYTAAVEMEKYYKEDVITGI